MVMSNAFRDREQDKFIETDSGETAVRVIPFDNGLVPVKDFDQIDITYPVTTQEVYTFTLSAVTVQTITVNYTDASMKA